MNLKRYEVAISGLKKVFYNKWACFFILAFIYTLIFIFIGHVFFELSIASEGVVLSAMGGLAWSGVVVSL